MHILYAYVSLCLSGKHRHVKAIKNIIYYLHFLILIKNNDLRPFNVYLVSQGPMKNIYMCVFKINAVKHGLIRQTATRPQTHRMVQGQRMSFVHAVFMLNI